MPYITQEARAQIGAGFHPQSSGALNYAITDLVVKYLPESPGYSDFNEVIGVLECAKLELYRRMAGPYEDQKRFDNGDVYFV